MVAVMLVGGSGRGQERWMGEAASVSRQRRARGTPAQAARHGGGGGAGAGVGAGAGGLRSLGRVACRALLPMF